MRDKMSKRELILIFLLLMACIAAILFYNFNRSTGEEAAQIYYDGELIREINLSQAEDQIITLDENDKVHAEIKDHKIRFTNVNCPDKICENAGYLYKDGDMAVCIPNKFYITIVSDIQ